MIFSFEKYRRFLTVGVVGAIGAVTQAVLLVILVELLNLHPVVGNTISAELVILLNFTLNNCWTFKSHTGKSLWVRLATFNIVVLGSITVQALCIWVGTHFFNPELYLLYMIIGIGLGWVLNYYLYTRLVWFRERETSHRVPPAL